MEGLRLLERLTAYEKNPDGRGVWDAEMIKASILGHLNAILNTRQGNALIAYDLGMPDFTDIIRSFDENTYVQLEKKLKIVLEKYETRLRNIQITALPKSEYTLDLRFKIKAQLNVQRGNISISFETIVNPEGRIELE